VAAARSYNVAIETVSDLSRFALYDALRVAQPTTGREERQTAKDLTELLRGSPWPAMKLVHPEPPLTTATISFGPGLRRRLRPAVRPPAEHSHLTRDQLPPDVRLQRLAKGAMSHGNQRWSSLARVRRPGVPGRVADLASGGGIRGVRGVCAGGSGEIPGATAA
jgi:hypothetical protein